MSQSPLPSEKGGNQSGEDCESGNQHMKSISLKRLKNANPFTMFNRVFNNQAGLIGLEVVERRYYLPEVMSVGPIHAERVDGLSDKRDMSRVSKFHLNEFIFDGKEVAQTEPGRLYPYALKVSYESLCRACRAAGEVEHLAATAVAEPFGIKRRHSSVNPRNPQNDAQALDKALTQKPRNPALLMQFDEVQSSHKAIDQRLSQAQRNPIEL
jgi:hypothetical protein